MKATRSAKNGLPVVLAVVLLGRGDVDGPQLGGHQGQTLGLEPTDDLPDEATFDGVGLADDESLVTHKAGHATGDRSVGAICVAYRRQSHQRVSWRGDED